MCLPSLIISPNSLNHLSFFPLCSIIIGDNYGIFGIITRCFVSFYYSRFVYPAVVIFVIATITFPKGLGQFMAGEVGLHSMVITNIN